MTTVAQMIEWMKTLPQDAEVECGVEKTKSWKTFMEFEPVDIEACVVHDYSSAEDRVRYPTMAGKVIVRINGE
jgi:hypothetical protein